MTEDDEYVQEAQERVKKSRAELDEVALELEGDPDRLDMDARERLEAADFAWRDAEVRLQELRDADDAEKTECRARFEDALDHFETSVAEIGQP
jgi:DNA repair exonuclease SbcCD ATPase subunit